MKPLKHNPSPGAQKPIPRHPKPQSIKTPKQNLRELNALAHLLISRARQILADSATADRVAAPVEAEMRDVARLLRSASESASPSPSAQDVPRSSPRPPSSQPYALHRTGSSSDAERRAPPMPFTSSTARRLSGVLSAHLTCRRGNRSRYPFVIFGLLRLVMSSQPWRRLEIPLILSELSNG